MSPIEWYYAHGSKQAGPVSSVELKRLALSGAIKPEDLVWREGLAEWALARSVRGLFEEDGKAAAPEEASRATVTLGHATEAIARPMETPAVTAAPAWHLLDLLLDVLRVRFDARFVETTARVFRACGLYGLLAAMLLTAAFTLIVATKTRSLSSLLLGVVLLLLLAALHYVAGKFCDALDRLNRSSAGSLASPALPDAVALLSLVGGVGGLLGALAAAVEHSSFSAVLPGVVAFIIGSYLAFVALNPVTLNVSTAAGELAVGEEALGAVTFLLKVLLRITPVVFGVGVVCGVLLMSIASYQAIAYSAGDSVYPLVTRLPADAARMTLICAATLPAAAYLLLLLYSLLLELCRAILVLPHRLDRSPLREENGDSQP
jgi:hypothetical protein